MRSEDLESHKRRSIVVVRQVVENCNLEKTKICSDLSFWNFSAKRTYVWSKVEHILVPHPQTVRYVM